MQTTTNPTTPQATKWLRDHHWPDNRGGEYAAPCHAQSHATGIIAPMITQHLLMILAKLECPGAACCLLIMLTAAQLLLLAGQWNKSDAAAGTGPLACCL